MIVAAHRAYSPRWMLSHVNVVAVADDDDAAAARPSCVSVVVEDVLPLHRQ